MARRSFLFLQGGSSPFFGRLADRLASDGIAVHRINFNGGDAAYWGRRPADSFRGTLEDLAGYYEDYFRSREVSDLVLYNDQRPVHVAAITAARREGIRIHVFEEGYFRPYLITLERGGVTGNSPLPRDPDWYREVGKRLPDCNGVSPFSFSLRARAIHDIAYEVANLGNPLLYPRYRTHVPYNRWIGYVAHSRRFAAYPLQAPRDRALLARLAREQAGVYLLPLQLESDAQIRHHSPFRSMAELIEQVMRSFALHAPPDARLVIKNHPLDPGFVNFRRLVTRLAQGMDLRGRVEYVDTGDASALVPRARGVITVNSTVGMSSLALGRPTIALGRAIYNMPGLTFQGGLDAFWREGSPLDPELFQFFRNAVMHTTQVHGGYYTSAGVALAVANCMRLLMPERSILEGLL